MVIAKNYHNIHKEKPPDVSEPLYIPVGEDLYSTLCLFDEDFPYFLSHDDLAAYRGGFANWHNQHNIEISYIAEGAVEANLPKEKALFYEGEAFAIFPDHLHSVKGVRGQRGRYLTVHFAPWLLYGYMGSDFYNHYYAPLLSAGISLAHFHADVSEGVGKGNALAAIRDFVTDEPPFESPKERLLLQRRLQDLWITLFFGEKETESHPQTPDPRAEEMLTLLREHYAEPFSLDFVAKELNLSRGECCRHFKKVFHMTMSEYLNEYRLGISMELLRKTDMSITEIAQRAGFSGASHYAARFREKTGITPREYRKHGM